jgi:hypothetical protein
LVPPGLVTWAVRWRPTKRAASVTAGEAIVVAAVAAAVQAGGGGS